MKAIGFFREMGHDGPSIEIAERAELHPDRNEIADYLDGGAPVVIALEPAIDPFHPLDPFPVDAGILTDGTHAWPTQLGLLVREWPIDVPEDALEAWRSA